MKIKLTWILVFKIFIALFWLLLFSLLLYGMVFVSTRDFKAIYCDVDFLLLIFFMGLSSIFLEKLHHNISITYFLLWYFGIPILFLIRENYSLLIGEIQINNIVGIGFYIGFFLFAFLSIWGFISYVKEKYKTFTICLIACLFFLFSIFVCRWYCF